MSLFTPEQYEAHQRRHGFLPSAAAPMPAPTTPVTPHPAEIKAERDMHALMISELRRRGVEFLHAPMNKRSQLPEGWPDFTIFLTGPGTVWLVEVKTPTGRLSREQEERIASLRAGGWRTDVVRSIEEFIGTLKELTADRATTALER